MHMLGHNNTMVKLFIHAYVWIIMPIKNVSVDRVLVLRAQTDMYMYMYIPVRHCLSNLCHQL